MNRIILCLVIVLSQQFSNAQRIDSTYAEKLGFPTGSKVVILHVDDVGMSWDSNEGAIQSITNGVANSCSVMMPCSWVPGFVQFYKKHPTIDVGLHLTLTSEWNQYRWPPLSGAKNVPGLVDKEGVMWASVEDVVKHANADEVEIEIKAQVERALLMGFVPTHLDSHMGTLFASPQFIERYLKVGMEYKIPVMFPAGHATLIKAQMKMPDTQIEQIRLLGKKLWDAGLPLIDDLHNESYGWELPKNIQASTKNIQQFKTSNYIKALKSLKPGITMIIMHCTAPSETFNKISSSGQTRKGDLLAMMDPAFKKALADQKIILTTWRELKERRDKIMIPDLKIGACQ
ncbi:MAG: polysaccharide deacetylase family protein [Chitinophagaceae bacterium]